MAPTVVVVGNVAYLGTLDAAKNTIKDAIQLTSAGNKVSEIDLRSLITARNAKRGATVQMPTKDAQYTSCPLTAESELVWNGLVERMKLVKAGALTKLENEYFTNNSL
jgi:hypothetical protein